MSWAEVKKINDNMNMPLDQLMVKLIGGFHREYIYQTTTYEVPWDGIFTIRAYCGNAGQYGKVVKKFSKGEMLTITITSNTSITITSNRQSTSVFHIQLTGKDANVNSNSADSIRAMAIGGAIYNEAGGTARVRSNNGIAAGGGGSGGANRDTAGWAGGAAYAYGTNCYALGGGGGGGSNGWSSKPAGGAGGAAYINGSALSSYCSTSSLVSGKGYNGGAGTNSSYSYGGEGGDGGCGGGCGYRRMDVNTTTNPWKLGGIGYFSDGGYVEGSSARGGNLNNVFSSNDSSTRAYANAPKNGPKGYFVGGQGAEARYFNNGGFAGGVGGFLGGAGGTAYGSTSDYSYNGSGAKGGYSPYGIGGNGGYGTGDNGSYHAGEGGDGKLIGGNGGAMYGWNANVKGGNGGNGFYPGFGGTSYSHGGIVNVTNYGRDGQPRPIGVMTTSFPVRGMTPSTSIVIIEAGDSLENF